MSRYFLELSYSGTLYHGWQIQQNAVSVQEKLNSALSILVQEELDTVGAGRTDTGVHAKQLYVHFDSNASILANKERFVHSLNALLPKDIAVRRLISVPGDAHARFDAIRRSYEYRVHFWKDPFLQNFSWQLKDRPSIELMNQAAALLIGRQDFSCFSKSHTQVFTNICQIEHAEWITENGSLIFKISADRFLRNMVRAIVGTLLEVGFSRQPPTYIQEVIASKNRSQAGTSVPACGLYLTEVVYPYIAHN